MECVSVCVQVASHSALCTHTQGLEGLPVKVQATPGEVDACSNHALAKHRFQHRHGVAAGAERAHQLGGCSRGPYVI